MDEHEKIDKNFEDEEILEIPGYDDMRYCQRCGGKLNADAVCEICHESEDWARIPPKNRKRIKCKQCGTEIYEARRYCFSCGTKNEAALKKGEHYCPHCGNAFEYGICPNCGQKESWFASRKIEDKDLRFCTKCWQIIHARDLFCTHCGNENFINKPFCVVEPRNREESAGKRKKYCEKCGGTLRFNEDLLANVCSTCKDDDEWTFFDPKYNKNKIKCKNCGEEMFEIRRFCKNCGTENMLAFKKADNYCPFCGIAFENGACPECGRTLEYFKTREIEEKNLRYCAVCDKEVNKYDYFCFYCGNENYIYSPLEVSRVAEAKEEAEFLERMKVRDEMRHQQLREYNERNARRREQRRKLRQEAELKKESEQPKEPKLTAKIPEHSKTTQSAGYSGYYYADLHTTLWLVLGIISLVICCMPTGIGTIICSIGAKRAENELEYNLAKRKTGWAKFWFFLGCAIVASLMVASVVIQVSQM